MNSDQKSSLKLIVPALVFSMMVSFPVFAQDESARQSPQQDGAKVERTSSETAAVPEDASQGTENNVRDALITAEVKTALAHDKKISDSPIHVNTNEGVVTLHGNVPSFELARHAAQLAERSDGVKSVNNQLMVVSSASTD
jgi:hyperosmotically inducible protein